MKRLNKVLSVVLVLILLVGVMPMAQIAGLDLSSLFPVAQAEAGSDGYFEYNGHYYKVFHIAEYWRDAKRICESMGGHLVTITSAEENEFVTSLFDDSAKYQVYWIGASYSQGRWNWITGEPWDFTNWFKGEPSRDGDFVQILSREAANGIEYQHKGTWNDKWDIRMSNDYWGTVGYICEWEGLSQLKTQELIVSYGSLEYVDKATVTRINGTTKIEAPGYYTAEFADNVSASGIMMFAAVPESTGSHISAVHCNGVDALVDAQYVEFPISGDSEEDNNRVVNIQVYTDLTNHNGFQLLYDGTVLETSENGSFSIKAKDITSGHTLKVRVIDSSGNKLSRIDTNIKTYKTTTTGSFADNKISISFPSDLKIIGGWKFDIDLSSLPFFVLKDEDTIKIGVGASEQSEYSKLKGWEDKTGDFFKEGTADALWKDWKKTVDDLKSDMKDNVGGITATNIMSSKIAPFGCNLNAVGELSPVKVDAKAAFYLELGCKNGQWNQSGANGFLSISCKFGATATVIAFYVPINFSIECKVGASADISLFYDVDNAKLDYNGTIEVTVPELTGSMTIGIQKVFNGGGFVKLNNKIEVEMWNNVKGTLTGDFGVEGTFVVFHGEKTLWRFCDWEYLNKDFGNSSKKVAIKKNDLHDPDIGSIDKLFNESAYTLDTRDYLKNQSSWLGGSAVQSSLKRAPVASAIKTAKLLQSSIYQQAAPQIVCTENGTMLMVWTADLTERSTGNQTAIVYSIYDESTNSWSAPAAIYDDGTADAYADVATDGNDIYVTWMNTNTTFDENTTVEGFASACEIQTAKYNKETGTFENVLSITDNDTFDFMPALYASDGEVYVAYAENLANSPLTMSGVNTVKIIRLDGDSFETVSETTIDHPVESLDIAVVNDALTAVLAVDKDSDMQTTEDVELCLMDETGALAPYTDNDIYESSACFSSINGETALTYYDASGIHYTHDFENEIVISEENSVNVSPEYLFIDDGESTVLLMKTNMNSSEKTNVYASVWDGAEWIGDARITDCNDDLKAFSASKTVDGKLRLVYTTAQYETEITEDNGDGSSTGTFTESVDMYTSLYERTTDIELIDVLVDDGAVNPGEEIPISLFLKNNGLTTVHSVSVSTNCNGETAEKQIDVDIKPGETVQIDSDFSVPMGINGLTDATFSAICDNDVNTENNTKTESIGYTDLSLELEKLSSGGLTSAVLTVTNNSCVATDAKVLLHKDSYDGEILAEYVLFDVPAFDTKKLYLSSDATNGSFEYGDTVCVEIKADKDEESTGDNFDFFTVDVPDVEEWSYSVLGDNKIRIDKYNGTETELVIPEVYDDCTVSAIGANAIPATVTSITLPKHMDTVSETAFNRAASLAAILVNEENETFRSKDGILCSADETKIVRCPVAYENKEISIEESITEIGSYAFADVGLTSVNLPESLAVIRMKAFSNNNFITLTIPESVSRIEQNSFVDCANLKTIDYNAIRAETDIPNDGLAFSLILIVNYRAIFSKDAGVETINIGANVQRIPTGLIVGLSGLKTVNIAAGSNLQAIEKYAFLNDPALTDVYYGKYYKDWQQISIDSNNQPLTDAALHCLTCEVCSWDDGIVVEEATCAAAGVKTFTCTVCGATKTEAYTDAGNHAGFAAKLANAKAATCGEDGYTGDTVCSGCGAVFAAGEIIPKETVDHTWDDGVVTLEPTEDAPGVRTYTCTVCSATRTEEIPPLTPSVQPGDINGDGVLNSKDLTRLMKYLAGEDVAVEASVLDVNGDGVVNNKDLTRLMKYLAGEDVQIF